MQALVYSLLQGAWWRSGSPLRPWRDKLAEMDPSLSVKEYKQSTGGLLAAGIPPRVLWSRAQLICRKWGSDRVLTAGMRRAGEEARWELAEKIRTTRHQDKWIRYGFNKSRPIFVQVQGPGEILVDNRGRFRPLLVRTTTEVRREVRERGQAVLPP